MPRSALSFAFFSAFQEKYFTQGSVAQCVPYGSTGGRAYFARLVAGRIYDRMQMNIRLSKANKVSLTEIVVICLPGTFAPFLYTRGLGRQSFPSRPFRRDQL